MYNASKSYQSYAAIIIPLLRIRGGLYCFSSVHPSACRRGTSGVRVKLSLCTVTFWHVTVVFRSRMSVRNQPYMCVYMLHLYEK